MRSLWSSIRSHARRSLPVFLGIVLLVAAIAWMSGAFRSKIAPGVVKIPELSAKPREQATVEPFPLVQTIEVVGTVEARRKTEVAGQILATVEQVNVQAGDTVRAGQTLVVLDDREIQAQLRENEAAAVAAEADLDVRTRDLTRYRNLLKDGAVTQEEFDHAQGRYRSAKAHIKRIEEQIARVRVMLTHAKIDAAAPAVVANRYVDPGDLAAPGKTLLTLYDPSEREVHASIPESLISDVKVNAPLLVRVDAVGSQWEGTVREIVPQARQASRSILVKITLPPEANDRVLVGMFGRVAIPVGKTELIVVPKAAVRHVGQEDLVDVVGSGDRLVRRFVRTGQVHGDKIEILSGLNVGEKVVLPPQ